MNYLSDELLFMANEEAIYNIYIYLLKRNPPTIGQYFGAIIKSLSNTTLRENEKYKLTILKNSVNANTALAQSKLTALTVSPNGLTACVFTKPNGSISVVFKGTGSGEWIDNGEGLSGICEENAYISYDKNGDELYRKSYQCDFASDQQVEALNWFVKTAAANGWAPENEIILSGHSKGGNKAQFVSINSPLVSRCYSFDGQGFSPEALAMLKDRYGLIYEKRRKSIFSLSAENDYVNVLGERLMPEENVFYFKSFGGLHPLEAILDHNGKFYHQSRQGILSKYVQSVSVQLMKMPPEAREYATLGVMNIFQKYLGKGTPVNGDKVSIAKTVIGLSIATAQMLLNLHTS
ncbi:MAG: Mbeg1-like protein [Clostridia bacterium]|nr:Mbeg1-like protein [Clostridia bacterium]